MRDLHEVLTDAAERSRPGCVPPFDDILARCRRKDAVQRAVGTASIIAVAFAAAIPLVAVELKDRQPGPPAPPGPVAGVRTGPLPGGETGCVELFSLHALPRRDFAFDGTIVRVAPAKEEDEADFMRQVTFDVHEWFRGGEAPRITVTMTAPLGTESDVFEGKSYEVGTRLLVSGEPNGPDGPLDDPSAFVCGFTRYHDQATADSWRRALR